ncbi:MAG: hypothetical protein IKE52_07435 [Mogibacterium sp.]|nr:hypothetical protein [Mogibacterium sp.]
MVIITVNIPVMELKYDFQIDEDVPFAFVRNEIAEMIVRKNQCKVDGDIRELVFWDKQRRYLIDMNKTAYENGLESGSELVMA